MSLAVVVAAVSPCARTGGQNVGCRHGGRVDGPSHVYFISTGHGSFESTQIDSAFSGLRLVPAQVGSALEIVRDELARQEKPLPRTPERSRFVDSLMTDRNDRLAALLVPTHDREIFRKNIARMAASPSICATADLE
jgi:hypothetical protein